MEQVPQLEGRPLAAIMSTSLAGPGGAALVEPSLEQALREEQARLVRELLPRHGGREVRQVEDGFLLEFPRGVQSVRFGLALLEAVATRNRLVAPERRFSLRLGIHQCAVVRQEGELIGEGINLAARMEALARPGSLYVSEPIAREVEGHPLPQARRLGKSGLKGIRLPVAVYRIDPPGASARPALFARMRSLLLRTGT